MRSYSKKENGYTKEECLEITKKHRESVINIMDIFCIKIKDLLDNKDKETPKNLENYKLQHLIKIVQEQVSTAPEKDARYKNIYKGNLERYLAKWLPKNLAIICRNTSVDLWNTMHKQNNKKSLEKESVEITEIHEKTVMDIMDIFCRKVKNLWRKHDKDKETPKNLEIYKDLLNHPDNEEIKKNREEIHNLKRPHHVEWFLACSNPKLQYLVEMICDNVAAAIARNAEYKDIYEEHKERYMQKWLPENLAIICTNTFIDLWESLHERK